MNHGSIEDTPPGRSTRGVGTLLQAAGASAAIRVLVAPVAQEPLDVGDEIVAGG